MTQMPESFRKLVDERGFHWAYALWEPTEEDKEAEREVFRELGRKQAERFNDAFMNALCGPVEITFPPDFTPPPVVVNGVTLAEWEKP